MPKKITACLIAVLLVLGLCSCSFKENYEKTLDKIMGKVDLTREVEKVDAESAIRQKIESYSDENIIWFKCDDFDSDGLKEAFAFLGSAGSDSFDGVIWYANENYAAEITENGKWKVPEIISAGGSNFLFTESEADGLTYVFGVEGSKVYESAVSGMFSNLKSSGGNDFTAEFTFNDYYNTDEASKDADPTTKLYWFYIKDGEFFEYGGDNTLKRADLRKYKTGGDVMDEIYENGLTQQLIDKYYSDASEETLAFIAEEAGYFKNIIARENGIINLNFYGAYEDNFYITFKIKGNDLEIIDCGRGCYLSAAVESIATYPEDKS